MHTTTRLGLDVLDGSDGVNTTPTVDAQAKGILDTAMVITEGTLVSRPSASSVAYGAVYYATDTATYYLSNGTTWATVSTPSSGLLSARPVAGVLGRAYYATDTTSWYQDNGTAWQLFAPALAVPSVAMTSQTRVLGSAYQPNASRPTFVIATFDTGAATNGNPGQVTIDMDASNPPTTGIANIISQPALTGSVTIYAPVTFLVPAAYYYKFTATAGSPSISTVFEYTL